MKEADKEIISAFRRKALDKIKGGYAKTRLMRNLRLTFDVFNRVLFDDLDDVEVRGSVIDKLQSYLGRSSKVSTQELDEAYTRAQKLVLDNDIFKTPKGKDFDGGGVTGVVKEEEKAMIKFFSGVSVDGKPVSDDNIMELLTFLVKRLSRRLPAGVEIVIKINSHKVI